MPSSSASDSSRRNVTTRRTSITIRNIRLTSILQPEDIVHHAETESGEEILSELLRHLALTYGIGNLKAAHADVMGNIASDPGHGRLEKVTEPLLAVATSEMGFVFDGIAGERFHVVVAVVVPIDMPGAYKQMLQGLEKAFPEEDTAWKVGQLSSAFSVWQHLEAGGHSLPDHLEARHVMDTIRFHLNTGDTLKTAIDGFIKHNTPELPVLNADRELVGVVTLKRLVRTCMPDYLMWVGDMSEFLNFEPLAEVIRNEAYTWIRDIMTVDFAQVDEEATRKSKRQWQNLILKL